jgi:hypothetical protein
MVNSSSSGISWCVVFIGQRFGPPCWNLQGVPKCWSVNTTHRVITQKLEVIGLPRTLKHHSVLKDRVTESIFEFFDLTTFCK